jgi:hypothetical protein
MKQLESVANGRRGARPLIGARFKAQAGNASGGDAQRADAEQDDGGERLDQTGAVSAMVMFGHGHNLRQEWTCQRKRAPAGSYQPKRARRIKSSPR